MLRNATSADDPCVILAPFQHNPRTPAMYFDDDALLPETQDELIITVAPYGPEWSPSDFPEDIAVTMDEQVQKAVDCYNAGATVLHIHVREADGKGSKRLSMFNELIARIARPGAEDGAAGRRLDLVLARGRGRPGEVARLRHAPPARGPHAEARPGDDRDQLAADEHHRTDDRGRRRGHAVREPGGQQGLGRHGRRCHADVLRRAPEAPAREGHPGLLHARATRRSSRRSSA